MQQIVTINGESFVIEARIIDKRTESTEISIFHFRKGRVERKDPLYTEQVAGWNLAFGTVAKMKSAISAGRFPWEYQEWLDDLECERNTQDWLDEQELENEW